MTQLGLARNRKSDFYIQNHYFKVLFGWKYEKVINQINDNDPIKTWHQ